MRLGSTLASLAVVDPKLYSRRERARIDQSRPEKQL